MRVRGDLRRFLSIFVDCTSALEGYGLSPGTTSGEAGFGLVVTGGICTEPAVDTTRDGLSGRNATLTGDSPRVWVTDVRKLDMTAFKADVGVDSSDATLARNIFAMRQTPSPSSSASMRYYATRAQCSELHELLTADFRIATACLRIYASDISRDIVEWRCQRDVKAEGLSALLSR